MLKTFRIGGIHPPENKLSAGQAIRKIELPAQVVIPLSQHLGAPAKAIVAKGDEVKVGTLLAEANGFVSASISSPVSGKITKIDTVIDSSGYAKPAIFIEVIGDEWLPEIDRSSDLKRECTLSSNEILEKIKAAGLVGMGGAAFPTHVKLVPPPDFKAEILIINGVECEPYLTADHQLMLEKSEEILVGVTLLMKVLNVTQAVIGIEANKPDAIKLLTEKATAYPGIQIQGLKMCYPQGGEKQLIEAITGKQVAPGTLPISTGAVVQNISTAFAVYEAVQKNKPLIERVITVTGKDIVTPSNLLVRLGTPMRALLEACGGIPPNIGKLIAGGPMMGRSLTNFDTPITKGSSGILAFNETESLRQPIENCIRCAKCIGVCPIGLEPYLISIVADQNDWEELERLHVMECIECGCCQFTCPAHRPLLDFCRLGKSKVGALLRQRAAKIT